jgi:hypothetical protein
MTSQWLLTVAPLAGLAADVAVQLAIAHIVRLVGVSIVTGTLSGLAVTAACTGLGSAGLAPPDAIAAWITAIATYVAFAFGYWAFLNVNISGLRVRTLREVLHAPDGISRTELMERYSSKEYLSRRLERLQRGNQLSHRGGRWRLEKKTLLVVARLMEAARALALPARAHPGRRID